MPLDDIIPSNTVYLTRGLCFYAKAELDYTTNVMPANNPLAFLRPLYDIAVWQFLLMLGARQRTDGRRVPFTLRMHEVVASFMCKLLEARAFSHLMEKMATEDIKRVTGHWEKGENPTTNIVEWCQDQW